MDGPVRKEVQKKLFVRDRWGLNVTCKSTTILKQVLFRFPLIPGSTESVDFHETLAYTVLKKDSNLVFQTETIDAIIHYKWGKLYPWLLLQLFLRIAYVLTLTQATDNTEDPLEYWTYFNIFMIFLQISFSKKSYLIWIYFLWPILNIVDLISAVVFIADRRKTKYFDQLANEHEHEYQASIFWLVLFTAMLGVLPWLRIFTAFRFYLTVLLKALVRTFVGFFLLMLCIVIW